MQIFLGPGLKYMLLAKKSTQWFHHWVTL